MTMTAPRSEQRTAAQPPAAPAAATTSTQPSTVRKLLLATDLSEASFSATEEAFELAALLGASLLIVSVIDPGSLLLPGGRFRARIDQVRERREQLAQELVERGRRDGITVSFLIWTGDPGDMIVSAAEAERVDMVLVGSHGRGAVGRLFLGSVSEHVVRNAPCPVLVCRPRETPPA
jgi:nucleotide-binding universal stress UspA family protein